MKLTYPLKDKQLKRYLNATEHYAINEQPSAELSEKETGGFFPLGRNDFWHAGIHLDGDQPVHAIAKGKVVAYRVTDHLIDPSELTIQFEEPAGEIRKIIEFPISSNFIVTQHTFPLPQGDFFQFYLVYMHLLPRQELSDAQKKALPLFHQKIVTVKHFSDLDGGGLSLVDENLKEIIVMPKDSLATVLDETCLANGYVPVSIQVYGQSYTGYADFLTKGNVANYSDLVKTDPKAKSNTGKYGDRVKITTKLRPNKAKTGLNIRQDLHSAAPVIDVAPTDAILMFETPGEITTQDRKLVVFPPNDSYKKITGYLWQGTTYKIEGYVYVNEKYLQVEQRYQPVIDKVENPRNLKIQAGDVLGWTSHDGTSAKKKTVHLELFINRERDLDKLRKYTKEQLEKNPELKKQKLLQLDSKNLLLEADINQAYQKTRFVTDISGLYEKAVEEAIKSYTMAEAVAEQCVAPDFRRMVVKHHTEWLPNDKDEKVKKRLEEPPYLWPPEKINAYKELYFNKLGFWHLLNESTTPDSDFGGLPYPDEVYYFHPIGFIEHLNKLQKDLSIKKINILVVDVRSGKPVVNALVKKVKVGDVSTEFKYDSKAISGISGKASQEALLGLGENPGSPSENYGPMGKAAYKSYWKKRGYTFELGKEEKIPEEEKMQAIINEYNHHRATDSNGVLKVSIPEPQLNQKKLTIEVSFHDFPVVAEKLVKDSRNKPILRNNTDETATGFSIEWTGNQSLEEGGNFGWTIKHGSNSSEFKTSEKFVVKDDEEKFTQFKNSLFSKHYHKNDYNNHFVLFAMQWCQPVWDYIADPVNPIAGSISQQSYIQDPEEINRHMHIVTYVKGLQGSEKYSGKGYGKCEKKSSGTKWRGGSGHAGIDVHARVNDNVFSVRGGKVTNSNTADEAGNMTTLAWAKPIEGQISYLHLNSFTVSTNSRVLAGQVIAKAGRTGNLESKWPGHVHLNVQAEGEEVKLRQKPDPDNKICIPYNSTPLLLPCICEVSSTTDNPANCNFNTTKFTEECWAVAELCCPKMDNDNTRRLQAQLRFLHENVDENSYRNPNGIDGQMGPGTKAAIRKFRKTNEESGIYYSEENDSANESMDQSAWEVLNELAPITGVS